MNEGEAKQRKSRTTVNLASLTEEDWQMYENMPNIPSANLKRAAQLFKHAILNPVSAIDVQLLDYKPIFSCFLIESSKKFNLLLNEKPVLNPENIILEFQKSICSNLDDEALYKSINSFQYDEDFSTHQNSGKTKKRNPTINTTQSEAYIIKSIGSGRNVIGLRLITDFYRDAVYAHAKKSENKIFDSYQRNELFLVGSSFSFSNELKANLKFNPEYIINEILKKEDELVEKLLKN